MDDELAEDRKEHGDNYDTVKFHAALDHLMASTTFSARFALGAGVDRRNVARVLAELSRSILDQDSAESMTPITLESLDALNS